MLQEKGTPRYSEEVYEDRIIYISIKEQLKEAKKRIRILKIGKR